MPKKVAIFTYGCSANTADSEIMAGLLQEKGFEVVKTQQVSDLNIINTCIVKTATEHRMIHKIKVLSKLNKPLIVAGCMPKTYIKLIEKINPRACLLGPTSIDRIVDIANSALLGTKVSYTSTLKKIKS